MEYLTGQYFLNSDLRAEEIRKQIGLLCSTGYCRSMKKNKKTGRLIWKNLLNDSILPCRIKKERASWNI
jgi:hypothetical protein